MQRASPLPPAWRGRALVTRIAAAWLTVAGFGWPLPSQAAHPTVCSAVDHGTGISSVECIIITGHRYRPEPPRPRPALIPGLSFGIGSSNAGASYGAIVKPLRADRRSEESLAKQKAENNSQRDDSCTDNPVVIATGEKLKDETDFTSSGLYGMSLVRTYRSAQSGGNLFGRNWRSSLDFPALLFSGCLIDRELPGCQGPTAITFTDSDGARYIYDYDGARMTTCPAEQGPPAASSGAPNTPAGGCHGKTRPTTTARVASFSASPTAAA